MPAGRDGRGLPRLLSAREDYPVEVEEYRELDGGRVLVLVHQGGRGKASGLQLAQMRAKGAAVLHVRDGNVTKFVL
jgi:hypothetical protein